MKVLALDFDGVICDSARELFHVGLRTYLSFFPDSSLAERPGIDTGLELESDPSYRKFLDLTPLGNRAEDFGVALRAIDSQVEITDQIEYDSFYASLDPDWLRSFHVRFYQHRIELRECDYDRWLRMHAAFTEFTNFLPKASDRARLAVVTAKDRSSVRILLRQFGIESLFPSDLILDKDTGIHKISHLRILQRRTDVPFGEITFVDDKVNHLLGVAELGVRLVLAGWGYNGEREHRLAREHGIAVVNFDDVDCQLIQRKGT
jgi:phosphoglycolate phosphatase-like HAD superfamily hydrolase